MHTNMSPGMSHPSRQDAPDQDAAKAATVVAFALV
jgi:hypothetical protein